MSTGEYPDAGQPLSAFVITRGSEEAELRLVGELDVASVARLDGTMNVLLASGCRSLVVDLTGVTFMDAAGLGALIRLQKRMTASDGVAEFVPGGAQPLRLLRITGTDRVLTFVPAQGRRGIPSVPEPM